MKILHILNGDSTLHQLAQTNITGHRLVWREILCEGETLEDIGSESFWENRKRFLQDLSKSSFDKHFERMKREFNELVLTDYDELVLWFEYDLFCQLNLLGLLAWINKQQLGTAFVSLICLGKHPKYEKLVGLGEVDPQEFGDLFQRRQKLDQIDIAFAAKIWEIYCKGEHQQLVSAIENEQENKFVYLAAAMRSHLRRFPDVTNGLTEIEAMIAQSVQDEAKGDRQIVGELLRKENMYGFGDTQYFKYLEYLEPILHHEGEKIGLNALGEKVLAGSLDFMSLRTSILQYGGAKLNDFRWDNKIHKLIKI